MTINPSAISASVRTGGETGRNPATSSVRHLRPVNRPLRAAIATMFAAAVSLGAHRGVAQQSTRPHGVINIADHPGHSVPIDLDALGGMTPSAYFAILDRAGLAFRESHSTDRGVTWSVPVTAISGRHLISIQDPPLNGNVSATTLPIAKYNSVAGSIGMVWHEWDSAGAATTDVFYSFSTNGTSWSTPTRVNLDQTTSDQFMPALAFDNSGNVFVSFYDRHCDPSNLTYQLFTAFMTSSGSALRANNRSSSFASNPTTVTNSFIGDYHNVTYHLNGPRGTLFNSTWTGIRPNGQSDLYLNGNP